MGENSVCKLMTIMIRKVDYIKNLIKLRHVLEFKIFSLYDNDVLPSLLNE